MLRRVCAAVATLALAGAVLVGCSDDGEPTSDAPTASPSESGATSPSESPSASPSAEPTSYLPVPAGVTLTEPGSELAVGQSAVVAWSPRQGKVGVMDVKIKRLQRTTFKQSFAGWKLTKEHRTTQPYFVRATITNRGESSLGGRRIPLYMVDGTQSLVEYSAFADRFKACPSTNFPKGFKPGDSTDVCLVFLAPNKGALTAISFRPTQEFVPITWTGPVRPVRANA